MTLKKLNRSKVPVVKINPRLNKYSKVILFKEKLDDANDFLDRVGLELPEDIKRTPAKRKSVRKYKAISDRIGVVNEPENTGSYKGGKRPTIKHGKKVKRQR